MIYLMSLRERKRGTNGEQAIGGIRHPVHKTTQRQRNKRLPGTDYDAFEFLTSGWGHQGDFVARIRSADINHAVAVIEGTHDTFEIAVAHQGTHANACAMSCLRQFKNNLDRPWCLSLRRFAQFLFAISS